MLFMVLLVSGIAFILDKWYKTEVTEKLRKLKKKIFWNDIISPFNLSYYTNCTVFYMLVDLKGTKEGEEASVISYLLAIVVFV